MKRYAIGVDVGGTSIKAGLVDDTGKVLHRFRIPTPAMETDGTRILRAIVDAAETVRSAVGDQPILGVGFGMPQHVVGQDWVQVQAFNLPALEGLAVRPALTEAFGASVKCDNDCQAAAVGEWHFGRQRAAGRLLYMVIGTGISIAIVDDGVALRYTLGSSGESGHVIVDLVNETECPCGGHGCLEAVAAGPALSRQGVQAATSGASRALGIRLAETGVVSAADIAAAARQGDAAAREIYSRAGRFIGIALTSYLHLFAPETIVIGGGVAGAGELVLAEVRRTIQELCNPFYLDRLRGVYRSSLGDQGGVAGAAALVLFGSV